MNLANLFQMAGAAPLDVLPPMRQELAVHRNASDAHGAPTYTLHDPSDNRFFQISWPAFEILARWTLGRAQFLLDSIHAQTTLELELADVEDIFKFLAQHHLLAAGRAQDTQRLAQAAAAQRMGKGMWLLKHYLFFRVPLVQPMAFLRGLLPWVAWLFRPLTWWLILGCAVVGVYLAAQQWDSFVHTFASYATWQGVGAIAVALSVSKVIHELGHATTAYRYGCRVPAMGVAFMVLVPMLYTDTNEAWKLPEPRQRLRIAIAGIAAELALASVATLAWSFLPDGPLRAAVFLLATTTWLATVAINISPFMRFDGYFVLCDWLGMANLHERSFALARWRMREWLFGLGLPAPEAFEPRRQRWLLAFAYATWVYRLVVFLGIAFLVYSLFFKLLGLLLLVVELGWFIVQPAYKEVKAWWQLRSLMRPNWPMARTLVLLALVVAALCVPWPRGEHAPAMLTAEKSQWLYAPAAGRVRTFAVEAGQAVAAQQVIAELDSPELQAQRQVALAREAAWAWQVQQQAFEERLQGKGSTLTQRLEAAREELRGIDELVAQLKVQSAFAGRVGQVSAVVHEGAWVRRGERLLQVVAPQGVKAEAFVDESQIAQIAPGASADFIADDLELPKLSCTVEAVDSVALPELEHPELGSAHGGPIPSKADAQGRAVPLNATFRVRLHQCQGVGSISRTYAGQAVIGSARRSWIEHWLLYLGAVVQREGLL